MVRRAFVWVVCVFCVSWASEASEPYEVLLSKHINDHSYFPALSQMERQEGYVILRISVDHSGNVMRVRTVKPSKHAALNKAALHTLRNATPLPEPPQAHLVDERADYTFPVVFEIGADGRQARAAAISLQNYVNGIAQHAAITDQ